MTKEAIINYLSASLGVEFEEEKDKQHVYQIWQAVDICGTPLRKRAGLFMFCDENMCSMLQFPRAKNFNLADPDCLEKIVSWTLKPT